MRLVLTHEIDTWGGTENYLSGLARALAETDLGDEVHVFVPEGHLTRWTEAVGDRVHVARLPDGLVRLTRMLRRLEPDVVHVNDPQPKTMAAARLAGVPLLVTTYHTPSLRIKYNRVGHTLWRIGAVWPRSHFIVLSEQNRTQLAEIQALPPEKIHVVTLGLGQERFEGVLEAREARRALDLPPNAFVTICAGRLEAQKAHEVLLEAFAKALPDMPSDSVLLVAGMGSRLEELQALTRTLGIESAVRFLGHVPSMPDTIRAADVNVLSSDYEGLPAVILEAMALGVPTLSTAVDGMRDLIVPGEGVLVPPRDPDALAAELVALASDRAGTRALGEAAKRKFRQVHTETTMVHQTRELYEELLKGWLAAIPGPDRVWWDGR